MGFVQLGGDCSALVLKGMAAEEMALVSFWWIDWFWATELAMIRHDCFVPVCKLLAMEGSTSLLKNLYPSAHTALCVSPRQLMLLLILVSAERFRRPQACCSFERLPYTLMTWRRWDF